MPGPDEQWDSAAIAAAISCDWCVDLQISFPSYSSLSVLCTRANGKVVRSSSHCRYRGPGRAPSIFFRKFQGSGSVVRRHLAVADMGHMLGFCAYICYAL